MPKIKMLAELALSGGPLATMGIPSLLLHHPSLCLRLHMMATLCAYAVAIGWVLSAQQLFAISFSLLTSQYRG